MADRKPAQRGGDERADALARAVAFGMWERDAAARVLGIAIAEVRQGYVRLAMTVRSDMLNGHGTLHGGFSFALADTAFAYACNADNQATVAAGCDIVFPAPGRLGDVLEAEATEVHRAGRSGVYDVAVRTRDGGRVIALFRGRSRTVGGAVMPVEALPS